MNALNPDSLSGYHTMLNSATVPAIVDAMNADWSPARNPQYAHSPKFTRLTARNTPDTPSTLSV